MDAVRAVAQRLGAGAVGADVVALDQDVGGAAFEDQTVLVVAGDDVAGGGGGAADDVADSGQLDAVLVVGQGDGAGAVGADQVAFDGVEADGAGVDAVGDAVAAVAGDDVPIARRGAADGVVGAAQEDAVELVADGLVAAGIGADVVALDGDADGRVLEVDAGLVARDDVGVGGLGPADERARAVVDLDAVVAVAQRDDPVASRPMMFPWMTVESEPGPLSEEET